MRNNLPDIPVLNVTIFLLSTSANINLLVEKLPGFTVLANCLEQFVTRLIKFIQQYITFALPLKEKLRLFAGSISVHSFV